MRRAIATGGQLPQWMGDFLPTGACANMNDMPNPPLFIDTHVHLDYLPDAPAAVRQARSAGVGQWIVPGVRREGWAGLPALAREIPGVLFAPGLHPQAADQWNNEAATELRQLLAAENCVALGEIGLDRLLDFPAAATQEAAFRGQVQLAVAAGRPILIHCRRATARLLKILREERADRVGGVFHAFSGSRETARSALDLGFAIGFGGVLTWTNARRAPDVLRALPAEAIVLETDAPDMAPQPHRTSENRPAWLPLIAGRVAAIRGWSLEETARITAENARRVLKIGI